MEQQMATVSHHGPYFYHLQNGLAVGSPDNHSWDNPTGLHEKCTFIATAHPTPVRRNVLYGMWVHDASVGVTDTGYGDISVYKTTLYATFINSGADVIHDYVVYLTIINP
ncbi:hypothetical protein [Bradyrhizobium sp. UNPF46]|uniref:hypothetical protein n=1 Tax=Bradyrhizobium sp. UNPF46 TaxID=1141168 RepID=UPI001152CA47|nr:hypothetical protein [Bradyrhizobium sp. UNPF46]